MARREAGVGSLHESEGDENLALGAKEVPRANFLLLANLALFFGAYLVAGGLGQNLAIIPGVAITFWPPAGIFAVVLLLNRVRAWPAYVLAAAAAEFTCNSLWFHNPPHHAALYFAGNALEAAAFAGLIKRFGRKPFDFESIEDIRVFLTAAVSAPILAATTIATVDHAIGRHPFTTAWPLVWLGDTTGLLVSAPLSLVVIHGFRQRAKLDARGVFETLGILAAIILIELLSLRDASPAAFLTMPLALWLAIRFQIRGAAVGIAFVAITTAIFTGVWAPGFADNPQAMRERAVMLQTFLAVISTSALVVAALAHQNAEGITALKRSNLDLEARIDVATNTVRAAQAHLSALYDASPIMMGLTEPSVSDVLHRYDNPASTEFMGVEPGFTENKWMIRDLGGDPETVAIWLRHYEKSDRLRAPVTFEHSVVMPEGLRWLRVTVAPVGAGEEGRSQFCYVAEDVTLRHRADESAIRLAALVESSADAIVSKNLEGIVATWNASAERIFGWSSDEMVGSSILRLIPEELQSEEAVIIGKLKRGERIEHFETVRVAKDGRRIEVSLSISPLKGPDGEVIGASKIARDISDRKRLDEALRRSESQFRELADSIAPLAWTADPTGARTWFNKRWHEYTGLPAEEIVGWGWTQTQHPDYKDRVVAGYRAAFAEGRRWEDTYPIRGKNGEYRWYLTVALPIRDEHGNIERWFGTNTDITEQRKLEEALIEANQRKDEFLATLAHELRNPLAPIQNGLEILRLRPDVAPPGEIVETMFRQVTHLTHLVDDLLDVARVRSGKIELRNEIVELSQAIHSAVESSSSVVKGKAHTLTIDLPEDDLRVMGDETRVTQIVANLITNAAKYTDPQGQIGVRLRRRGDRAEISVTDNGVGISPEIIPTIWDLFSQVRDTIEKAQGGLGIGLSLVKRLTELHGGSVAASSPGLGRGSTFTISLPLLASPIPNERNEVGKAKESARSRRILVIDDNRDVARMMTVLLETNGHSVETAYSGNEGIITALKTLPDLVLCDIGMPDIDGYEIARRLRNEPSLARTLLVAVTGWGREEDRDASRAAGFDDHLTKPVEYVHVDQILHRLT